MSTRFKLVVASLAATTSLARAQSFTYPDFSSVAGLNMVGEAAQSGTRLRVHNNVVVVNGGDNRGAAWYATPVNVASGFDTTFEFNMNSPSSSGGGDGMAFVIQNDQVAGSPIVIGSPDGTGNLALGRHAAACGYGLFATSLPGESVDNSLAIELDCFNNSAAATWGDLDSNHISVHTGGSGDNSEHESYSIGRALTGALGTDLNNAATHTLRVLYVPGTLEVYLDGNLQISAPYDFVTGGTWIDSATSVGGLSLIGGTQAYVGFTASSGSVRENHDILSWTWTSTVPPNNVPFCFGDGSLVDHTTPCPCGNNGAPGNGCGHSFDPNGANLSATGTPALDDVVLHSQFEPASSFTLMMQHGNGGDSVFHDGVLCASNPLIRLRGRAAVGGEAFFPNSNFAQDSTTTLSARGGTFPGSGATMRYAAWFRNASTTFCPPATANVTNGWVITW